MVSSECKTAEDMKRKLKSGTLIKLNGIPVSLCDPVEVETSEGNASLIWDESGQIIRRPVALAGGPVRDFGNEKSVVLVDKLLEVIAKTHGCRVEALKAPIRLQDTDGVKLGEFVVERLIIALLSEVVAKGVKCHSDDEVSSGISLENSVYSHHLRS